MTSKKALLTVIFFIFGLSLSFFSLNREFKELTQKYEKFEKNLEKTSLPTAGNKLQFNQGQRKLQSFQVDLAFWKAANNWIKDEASSRMPRMPRIRRSLPDAINFVCKKPCWFYNYSLIRTNSTFSCKWVPLKKQHEREKLIRLLEWSCLKTIYKLLT